MRKTAHAIMMMTVREGQQVALGTHQHARQFHRVTPNTNMRRSIMLPITRLSQGLRHIRDLTPRKEGLLEHWVALVAAMSSVVEPAGHLMHVDRMVPPGP